MSAHEALERARQREAARAAAEARRPRIDYAAANKQFKRQKAALTRAVNTGDPNKVVEACEKAVKEWNADFPCAGSWPDDWSRWQRALDDVFPVFRAPRLEDLA